MAGALNSTIQTFIDAESQIAPLLPTLGLRRRALKFVPTEPGVNNAAVHFSGEHIAINDSRLREVDLAVAIGILLHEYGHIKQRTRVDGTYVTTDERACSVSEEENCERFVGFYLRILNFSIAPFEAFLYATEHQRDSRYPALNVSIQVLNEGFEAADASILRARRKEQTSKMIATGVIAIALIAGILLVGNISSKPETSP